MRELIYLIRWLMIELWMTFTDKPIPLILWDIPKESKQRIREQRKMQKGNK